MLRTVLRSKIFAFLLLAIAWVLFLWKREFRAVGLLFMMASMILIRAPQMASPLRPSSGMDAGQSNGDKPSVSRFRWLRLVALAMLTVGSYVLLERAESLGIQGSWPVYLLAVSVMALVWVAISALLRALE